jgi:hypothetical protein
MRVHPSRASLTAIRQTLVVHGRTVQTVDVAIAQLRYLVHVEVGRLNNEYHE